DPRRPRDHLGRDRARRWTVRRDDPRVAGLAPRLSLARAAARGRGLSGDPARHAGLWRDRPTLGEALAPGRARARAPRSARPRSHDLARPLVWRTAGAAGREPRSCPSPRPGLARVGRPASASGVAWLRGPGPGQP